MAIDPNAIPDTELGEFNQNLAQTQSNLGEVRGFVKDSIFVAKRVEDSLETFARIESAADGLADFADGLKDSLKLVGKISPLKVVAKKLGDVLDDIKDALISVRDRAKQIDEDIEDSGAKTKAKEAREKLEEYDEGLKEARIELAEYQASGLELECALDIVGNETLINSVDALIATPNDLVAGINQTYSDAKDAVSDLNDAIQISALDAAAEAQQQLENIASKLSPLTKPLDLLSSAIKPVKWALDAVDKIVDKVISPIVNPILEALGVNKLFDTISAKLKALLPNAGDLDNPADQLLDAVGELIPDVDGGVSVGDFLDTKLQLQSLLNQSLDFAVSIDAQAPGVILGSDVADLLEGDAGDNVMSGGAGNDRMNGGAGADTFIGGDGDDVITAQGADDRVVLRGLLPEYSFEFFGSGNDLRISHTSPADPFVDDGVDTVLGAEIIVFGDGLELTVTAIKSGLQISDGSGGPDNSPIMVGIDDPDAEAADFLIASDAQVAMDMSGKQGKDFLLGGLAADELKGNAGDDTLDGGDSIGDFINGNTGFDTVTFQSRSAVGARIDLGLDAGEARVASFDRNATLIKVEAVEGSDLADFLYGSDEGETLSGNGGDDLIRGYAGDDDLHGGSGNDVLVLGQGDDMADGGSGDDVFVMGEGGDNSLIGGAGFDRVTYTPTQGTVFSFFDRDVDGWVTQGAGDVGLDPRGNSGSAMTGTDNASSVWHFVAPEKFLGDQSDKSGGTFSFDLSHDLLSGITPLNVALIYGDGITLSLSIDSFGAGWTTNAVSLTEGSQWRVHDAGSSQVWTDTTTAFATQEQIDAVLANITDIHIRGDLSNGADVSRLDNVMLSDQTIEDLNISIAELSDDFDDGSRGWKAVSLSNYEVVANSTKGLFTRDFDGVDGSVAYQQSDYSSGIWYFSASTSYLGDMSAYDRGSLSFYLKNSSATDNPIQGDNLILKGNGQTYVYNTTAPVAGAGWTYYQASLIGSDGWVVAGTSTAVTDDDFAAALADLEAIYIRGEFRNGPDEASIDNVVLRGAGDVQDYPLYGVIDVINTDPIAQSGHSIDFDGATMTVETRDGEGTIVATDTLDGIEEVRGTTNDDMFDGRLADRFAEISLRGEDGDDVFLEGLGQQSIDGGAGDDTITVTSASTDEGDRLVGGSGYDTLDLREVADTSWRVRSEVYSADANSLMGYFRDTEYTGSIPATQLNGFEEIHTGQYADIVITDAMYLKTYGGNDYIISNDNVGSYLHAGTGDDEIISFYSIEKSMYAGAGNDIIRFLSPVERYGGTGTMYVNGGRGDDLFSTNGGNAIIVGGEGNDTLYFAGDYIGSLRTDVSVDLENGAVARAEGALEISGIENLGGGDGDDVLKGDDLSNILVGGDGDDILYGRGSVETEELAQTAGDVIFGGRGNDILRGGQGDDVIYGGSGTDAIYGGDGIDTASWQAAQENVELARIDVDPLDVGRVDVTLGETGFAKFTRESNRNDMEYQDVTWLQSGSTAMSGSAAVYDGGAGFTQFISLTNAGNTDTTFAKVTHDLDLIELRGLISISFDAYLIDGWDSEVIQIEIDGTRAYYDTFTTFGANEFGFSESKTWDFGTVSVESVLTETDSIGFGAQNDAIYRFTVTTASYAETVNLAVSTNSNAVLGIDNVVVGGPVDGEIDFLDGIENLIGGNSNDYLEGDGGDNVLTGDDGDDVLIGNDGDDTLLDGAGDDTVEAGDGDDIVVAGVGGRTEFGAGDVYDGGAGRDFLDYSGLGNGVVLNLSLGRAFYRYEIDMPVWTDTGTTEAREFDMGRNDAQINPWEAYLRYQQDVDETVPTVTEWLGTYPRLDSITSTKVTRDGVDWVTGFEDYSGTNFADQIITDDQDNEVWDLAGDDVVQLGGGNDTLNAGTGIDFFDGGDGIDMLSYAASEGGVTIDLDSGVLERGEADDDSMEGFESATGSLTGRNTLKGNDEANVLIGGNNGDVLKGRSGSDVLDGGAGDDKLMGDNGADRLIGGAGDDELTGGNWTDTFVFGAGSGSDVILDFTSGQDTVELSGIAGITSVANAMAVASQDGTDVVFALSAQDILRVENITLAQIEDDISVL
ncbi:laminin B domain-containing protein [Algirhabdus cladophorae]|uniref:laminin B domain-containing protein n=1 Tax=Algirhabdus cladophorae TaxID=3377108 RepID=UPI003B845D97